MSFPSIKLPIEYIEELRDFINENEHLILNNDPYRREWNVICACVDRIEDTTRYLNSKVLGEKHEYGCAFDLMEFLSHSASMLNCIDTIIDIFKAEKIIKKPEIIFKEKIVTGQGELEERLANIRRKKPYKNEDDLYFEYIRSIGVMHPNDTDRHPFFQRYKKEVSPFLIWNHLLGLAGGDISLHVYDSNGEKGIHSLKLNLEEIYAYIASRYRRIPILKEFFHDQISSLKTKLKSQAILSKKDFSDYREYLFYLRSEARKRNENLEYCINETAKMIGLSNIPKEVNQKYLKYCRALKYSMDDLRTILQAPILDDGFDRKILAEELHLPDIISEDETNATCYYYEKAAKLYDENSYGEYDIEWFRVQARNLYKIVKQYAPIDDSSLDGLGNLQLLAIINTALYFYSLDHNTFINESIPMTNSYR